MDNIFKQKINSRILAAVMSFCVLVSPFSTAYAAQTDGKSLSASDISQVLEQNSDGYYLVQTAGNLRAVLSNPDTYWGAKIRLTSDIDLTGAADLVPLGSSTKPFRGTFDGGNFVIKNYGIEGSTGYTGFFGKNTGTIMNITIQNAQVKDSNQYYTAGIGVLVGYNEGIVENARVVHSSVTGSYSYLGGLVGYNNGSITQSSVADSTILSNSVASMGYTGGFAGYNKKEISLSYVDGGTVSFKGSDSKGQAIGGFIGRNDTTAGIIQECYTTAEVSSEGAVAGGFVGSMYNGTISDCFSSGGVTAIKKTAGFVGQYNSGKFVSCYTVGSVKATGTSIYSNYFGEFYGDGFWQSKTATASFYLSSELISITGNGTKTKQNSALKVKTEEEAKSAEAYLGVEVWKNGGTYNSGFPILKNVEPPHNFTQPDAPVQLTAPSPKVWNGATVSWQAVNHAASYAVSLYRKSERADVLVKTYGDITGTEKDFSDIITTSGSYYITVKAISGVENYLDSMVSAHSEPYVYTAAGEDGYILLKTQEDILSLSGKDADLTKNYRLMNNIDMDKNGKVIGVYGKGSADKAFSGTIDGNGFTISNLAINGEALFANLAKGGTVTRLTIKNASVEDNSNNSSHYPAVLAAYSEGTISHCLVQDSAVNSVYNSVTGGLVGFNRGNISFSAVEGGSVTYKGAYGTKTGGFVGRNMGNIDQCYANTAVSGSKWVGGFAGSHEGSIISNCYAVGSVTAAKQEAGGFAGTLIEHGALKNVYASNDVSGESGGGLVGGKSSYSSAGTAENSYYNTDRRTPGKAGSFTAGSGKAASEMKTAGFAALLGITAIWSIPEAVENHSLCNGGYPYLTAVPLLDKTAPDQKITVQLLTAVYDYDKHTFILKKPVSVTTEGESVTVKTVLDAAAAANAIHYSAERTGSNGYLVKTIDGVTPERPSGWMFTVNDKLSNVGITSAPVKNGDKILWYEGTPSNFFKAPTWDELINGSQKSYVEIGTKDDLIALANSKDPRTDWSKNYKLAADIDLAGVKFTPIGTEKIPFSGTFDGANHKISNLCVNQYAHAGLFGVIRGTTIQNLKISAAIVTGNNTLGILAGLAKADAAAETANLIANCHVQGKITADGTAYIKQTDVGGLIGVNDGGQDVKSGKSAYSTIDSCSAEAAVAGRTKGYDKTESGHVGGLVGWNKGYVIESSASGNVLGGNTTGGFAGSNFGSIYRCSASGNVIGGYSAGGFVGSSGLYSRIENSYATGNVVAISGLYSNYFGGFAGAISGTVKNCVSTGTLTPGWSYNGGFAGSFDGTLYSFNEDLLTLSNCYGNAETNIGATVKGLGNYLNGLDETVNLAAAKTGVSAENARENLKKILDAVSQQKSDTAALREEAEKYKTYVTIPSSVRANMDVTAFVSELKPGKTIDDSIAVRYQTMDRNRFVTSVGNGQSYYLSKTNNQYGDATENILLLFKKNNAFYTRNVTVAVKGAANKQPLSSIAQSISRLYDNPVYGGTDSDWEVFDMAAYKSANQVFSSTAKRNDFIRKSLEGINPNVATDYERVAIMITSLGIDASDLIAEIAHADVSTVNELTFALIAYDSGNYTVKSSAKNSRTDVLRSLLTKQNADGSWAYDSMTSEVSMTAMVLTALSSYNKDEKVKKAIDKGLHYLSAVQTAEGGYSYNHDKANSNDAAMVVIALTALGIDADTDSRFIKNDNSALDNLRSFITADNTFGYQDNTSTDGMSTEQGFRALTAYSKKSSESYNIYQYKGTLNSGAPGKITKGIGTAAQGKPEDIGGAVKNVTATVGGETDNTAKNTSNNHPSVTDAINSAKGTACDKGIEGKTSLPKDISESKEAQQLKAQEEKQPVQQDAGTKTKITNLEDKNIIKPGRDTKDGGNTVVILFIVLSLITVGGVATVSINIHRRKNRVMVKKERI